MGERFIDSTESQIGNGVINRKPNNIYIGFKVAVGNGGIFKVSKYHHMDPALIPGGVKVFTISLLLLTSVKVQ